MAVGGTPPQETAAARLDARAVVDAVSRHGVRPAYLNFVEDLTDVRRAFGPLAWRQLVGIKSAVDPTSVFLANHPIPTRYEDGAPDDPTRPRRRHGLGDGRAR